MSKSFRPVKEVWGESISEFVNIATLGDLLTSIAQEIGCEFFQSPYLNMEVFWIQDGYAFFEYIQDENKFNLQRAQELFPNENKGDLESLISNMQSLARIWYKSLESDGSIRFYMD
jgi:hypothetical protein